MTSGTRDLLIDQATPIVRKLGYAGFSYADLTAAVGIRKPSIHHHFPLKEDLGEAIVTAYTDRFLEQLAQIWADDLSCAGRLWRYTALYREAAASGEGCLCGVLASEFAGLPAKVRSSVHRFFAVNLDWLERVLRDATSGSAKQRTETVHQQARLVLSTLQGAMCVALALGSTDAFDATIAGLMAALK